MARLRIKIFIFVFILLTIRCANYDKHKKIIGESIADTPLWIHSDMSEDDQYIYFVEKSVTKEDPIFGLRTAKEKLIKRINIQIGNQITQKFRKKIEELDYEDWIETIEYEFKNMTLKSLDFKNLIPDDTYYNKLKMNENKYYECYVYKAVSKSTIKTKEIKSIDTLIQRYIDNRIKKFLILLKDKYTK